MKIKEKSRIGNTMISNIERQTEILLVDDKPENLKILIQLLEDENLKVLIATSGERAIMQTERRPPDLILLDILMPNMDGFETCKRIKSNPKLSEIPIIFITALSDVESKIKAFSVGGVDYISKPFLKEEVLARIETHLTISAQQKILSIKNEQITESQKQFFDLFEHNPISLWEEDFSEVKMLLYNLEEENKNDISNYLDKNPKFVETCIRKIKILNVNGATLKLHGMNSKEELIVNFNSIFNDKSLNTFKEELICIAQDKTAFNAETEFIKDDGTTIHALLQMIVLEPYSKVIVSMTDISDRKQAEIKLESSELKFRLLADYTHDWEYWIDQNFNYIYLSPSFEQITGYTIDEFISEKELMSKMVRDDYKEKFNSHFLNAELGKNDTYNQVHIMEFPIIAKNGEEKWLEHNCTPVYDEDGNYAGRRGNNRDITNRKKSDDVLRKLSKATEQSPISIVITNLEGNIEYVNPKFAEVTGYTFEEVQNKNPRILNSGFHPAEYYKNLWETIKNGNIWSGELHNKKKSGELFWESATIAPIKDEDDNITHFVGVKEDITEKKKIEVALRENEKKYRMLAENSVDYVWEVDLNLNVTYASPGVFAVHGFTQDEAMKMGVRDFHPEEKIHEILERAEKELAYGTKGHGVQFESL